MDCGRSVRFFLCHQMYSTAQLARFFYVRRLDKPWPQVSTLLSHGARLDIDRAWDSVFLLHVHFDRVLPTRVLALSAAVYQFRDNPCTTAVMTLVQMQLACPQKRGRSPQGQRTYKPSFKI